MWDQKIYLRIQHFKFTTFLMLHQYRWKSFLSSFATLMHQGSLLKITPGWAAGVPLEQTQVHLLTLPNVWRLFRLGVEGFLVTPLRHICVMLWAWAPKSALGSYKRLRSSHSHLEVVLQTTMLLGANVLLIFPY